MQSSSDDDLNEMNKVLKQTPNFISIKDLKEKEPYRILKFEIVETTNGKRVRLTLNRIEKSGNASSQPGCCIVRFIHTSCVD